MFTAIPSNQIYLLSLHDALPISRTKHFQRSIKTSPRKQPGGECVRLYGRPSPMLHSSPFSASSFPNDVALATSLPDSDRKSTRLNSSHITTSYAVFCLKKKNQHK